jgi:hypothetical protein
VSWLFNDDVSTAKVSQLRSVRNDHECYLDSDLIADGCGAFASKY